MVQFSASAAEPGVRLFLEPDSEGLVQNGLCMLGACWDKSAANPPSKNVESCSMHCVLICALFRAGAASREPSRVVGLTGAWP